MVEDGRAPGTECSGRAPGPGANAMPETRRALGDRRASGTDGRAPLGPSSRRERRREGADGTFQSPRAPSAPNGVGVGVGGHGPVPSLNTSLDVCKFIINDVIHTAVVGGTHRDVLIETKCILQHL